jgi:hypothetical protein
MHLHVQGGKDRFNKTFFTFTYHKSQNYNAYQVTNNSRCIPYGPKIYVHVPTLSIPRPPKIYPNCDFWYANINLATLIVICSVLAREHKKLIST